MRDLPVPADEAVIHAVASGAGRAAIAVVRLSGAGTGEVLDRLVGSRPAARRAMVRRVRDAAGEVIDEAMVLWMPGPGTYTGEDCAELHVHGGAAVLRAVGAALAACGVRPAEPGEFTRRAFLAGRMDLLQAEAVADLVAAETEAQRRQALRQLGGAVGAVHALWRDRLVGLLAAAEAEVEFPEEVGEAETARLGARIGALSEEIRGGLGQAEAAERLRDGVVVVVTGRTNVGKSSLVNALAGREAAIVSDMPGTTRDAIELRLEWAGVPVLLVDTAGVRESADPVEAEGVRRALRRRDTADLVIRVVEAGEAGEDGPGVLVASKVDLGGAVPAGAVGVSARTGEGLATLRAVLEARVRGLAVAAGDPVATRARHRAVLEEVVAWLQRAQGEALPELRAEALRQGVAALGRLTGRVSADSVLDRVFGEFCIGK